MRKARHTRLSNGLALTLAYTYTGTATPPPVAGKERPKDKEPHVPLVDQELRRGKTKTGPAFYCCAVPSLGNLGPATSL